MTQTTQNSRVIRASANIVYAALTSPKAKEYWQVPGNMTGVIHRFELKEGAGYEMSLFYPDTEKVMKGKTAEKEDKFSSRFVELVPNSKIVEAINFDTKDKNFSEEMIMEITLEPRSDGTKVNFLFKNIPKGIKLEDNEAGTMSSLKKLAKYVE